MSSKPKISSCPTMLSSWLLCCQTSVITTKIYVRCGLSHSCIYHDLPTCACLDALVQCVCLKVACTTLHVQLSWCVYGDKAHTLQDLRASVQHDLIALHLSWLKRSKHHCLPFPQQEKHHANLSHPSCISAEVYIQHSKSKHLHLRIFDELCRWRCRQTQSCCSCQTSTRPVTVQPFWRKSVLTSTARQSPRA